MGPSLEELLPRIPLDAKQVIKIGADHEALGRAFRRRNPAVQWMAVDAQATQALAAIAPGSIDAVVIHRAVADQAEPWDLIRRLRPLLAPDGVLLLATPNPWHWKNTAALLRGTWPDGRFHADPVRRQLSDAGLFVVDAVRCGADRAGFDAFAAQIAPALTALGVPEADHAARAAADSVLWRASPQRPASLTIVGRTLRPQAAMIDVRMAEPLFALASRPGVSIRLGVEPQVPKLAPGQPGIFILQRIILTPQGIPYLRALRDAGYVIVQEFDDDPQHNARLGDAANLAFTGVHAVQTSTEPLSDVLREWNAEVAVMPNMLAELPEPVNFQDPQRLKLFFGALNRTRDIEPFLPALNAALAEADGRLGVEVVYDRAVFDALQTPHKRFTPLCDYPRYKAMMASCDIAFLPLADIRFNRMKSDLKWVEASGHGLVSIASPVVYDRSIRHGETGFLAATPEDLTQSLRAILADPARARSIALAARAEVAATRLHVHGMARRRAWYESLWARRAELDAKLLERVPALAG